MSWSVKVGIGKTWFIDFDGCIVKHGTNEVLPGVKEWFEALPTTDYIAICTAREFGKCLYAVYEVMETLLKNRGWDLLDSLPQGERILVNDIKPAQTVNGETFDTPLKTAYAINLERNKGLSRVKI